MKLQVLLGLPITGMILLSANLRADTAPLPGAGFAATRYEVLWAKSPFSVSSETAPESPDYALVGVAQFDGIYYVSLIDQKSQEHFLVTSAKPARGLVLVSVTPGHGTSDTFAMLQRSGQTMTLKMQQVPVAATAPPPANPAGAPVNPVPAPAVLPMPGEGAAPNDQPPQIRLRHPSAHVPPRPP